MTISDPNLARELAQRERQLTALRAAFLIAAHHGVALRPEELPKLIDGDMVTSVMAALTKVGLRSRLMERCTLRTTARLGTAYPALIPCKDGAWVILIMVMEQDGASVAAILDPANEAGGVQTLSLADLAGRWTGQILLVQRAVEKAARTAFGLSWFMPALWSQSRLLAGVALAVATSSAVSSRGAAAIGAWNRSSRNGERQRHEPRNNIGIVRRWASA
jgi:ATP-binding cassette subfamily B protein